MYPDFLCIGAQKSGTSWLQRNMETHPQIWLPPIKEVHYLDGGTSNPLKSLFSNSKRARKGRTYLIEQIRALPRVGGFSDLKWALHYCFTPRSDAWYRALFPEAPGKIAGEICPGYARLRNDEVGRVHQMMPNTKIIYLIRNPIDRSWSYASQYFTSPRWKGRYGSVDKVPKEELQAFFRRDCAGHSDYLGALDSWQRYFGEGQMLLGFFDELASDPRTLFKRVLDFVGADSSDEFLPATVAVNRDRGRGSGIPEAIRADLAKLHYVQLQTLHTRLDNAWTTGWLASAEEALNGESRS
jgi:hypothetical protein